MIKINDFITCLDVEGRCFSAVQYIGSLFLQNSASRLHPRRTVYYTDWFHTGEVAPPLFFQAQGNCLSHNDALGLHTVHCHLD